MDSDPAQAQAEDRRAQIQADLRRVANTEWLAYADRTMLLTAASELSRLSRVEQALRDLYDYLKLPDDCRWAVTLTDPKWIEMMDSAKAALSASPEAQPCSSGHTWTNHYGDDWTPDTGTLCDCRKKQWGIPEAQPEDGR